MTRAKSVAVYVRHTVSALMCRPHFSTLANAVRYGPATLQRFRAGAPEPLSRTEPWMCFPALDRLRKLIHAGMTVFEYGSGASTLFFLRNGARVVSVEHDETWFCRVRIAIEREGFEHVDYSLIAPAMQADFRADATDDPAAYVSSDLASTGKTFREYASRIDAFPDHYFDLVVVDGRARPSCLWHGMPKVKPGGTLLLDQSERAHYLRRLPELQDSRRWTAARCMGPLPGCLHFTEATFFTKRAA